MQVLAIIYFFCFLICYSVFKHVDIWTFIHTPGINTNLICADADCTIVSKEAKNKNDNNKNLTKNSKGKNI